MIFRRYGMFTGGIELPEEKSSTIARAIEVTARPDRLLVPLATCGATPARPTVDPGDTVSAGQRIGAADDPSAVDVFAPLAGRVAAMATVAVPSWGGFVESAAVEIVDLSDPAEMVPPREQDSDNAGKDRFDWQQAGEAELLERLAEGQLTTHRRSPLPLAAWLMRARAKKCRWTILNAIDHEPQVSSDHRLLVEFGPQIIEGLAIVAKMLGTRKVFVAADHRRTGQYGSCDTPAERFAHTQVALPHKYPIGADNILTKVLTRREVPPGKRPLDVGAAIIDAASCLAIRQWIVCGRRLLGRVVTVAGPHTKSPGNFWTPFGTPCADLVHLTAGAVEQTGGKETTLTHGGPMAGAVCDARAVVTPATGALLGLEAVKMPLPSPCIRCGWCTDHCPARLNVAVLNDAFELSLIDRARLGGALACVECGVCSYICPARLPLTQRVKQLKRRIIEFDRAAETPAGSAAP